MRLNPTTSMDDAIKRIADGHSGAASVVALLVKEYPDNAMDYMRALDRMGVYGASVWNAYQNTCDARIDAFLLSLSRGKF